MKGPEISAVITAVLRVFSVKGKLGCDFDADMGGWRFFEEA